jgi:hypothetical protein
MPGLLRGVARVGIAAGTATAVSNRVSRRQASRWSQQEAEASQPQQYEAPPPPSNGGTDPIEKLKQLAELRDQGILTEEEFAAQKARILS